MVSDGDLGPEQLKSYNIEQSLTRFVQVLKSGAVSLESIHTFERTLSSRGLLAQGGLSSIRFLAETERNVFLWRHGLSLRDKDRYDFWIDLRALIGKRVAKLSDSDPDNPFHNSSFGSSQVDPSSKAEELEYLDCFLDIMDKSERHLSALSVLGSMLCQERLGAEREVVILPRSNAPQGALM